jgi:hypothetical protein
MGRIMVLEYHLITDHNGNYKRERNQFRQDMELLYQRGYRPVNMAQVLDRKLNLPRGLSPVVITFDDASPEQFSYIEKDGKLEIDPNSGVGIWLDFRKTHPDWDNRAVFCLLSGAAAGRSFFGDRGIQVAISEGEVPCRQRIRAVQSYALACTVEQISGRFRAGADRPRSAGDRLGRAGLQG